MPFRIFYKKRENLNNLLYKKYFNIIYNYIFLKDTYFPSNF